MNYNKDGIKYFLYLCTKNIDNKHYMILPNDIKILIWDYIHYKPFIQCLICNDILLNFYIDIRENINNEYFTQFYGAIKCNNC